AAQYVGKLARVGDDDQPAADRRGKNHRRDHAVGMKERDGSQQTVLTIFPVADPAGYHERVGDQIAMKADRALGEAGRAARILQQRNVVTGDGDVRLGTARAQGRKSFIVMSPGATSTRSPAFFSFSRP